jgi:hypothetical protein
VVADLGRPVCNAMSLGERFPAFISRNKAMSLSSRAKDSNKGLRLLVACR